MSFKTLMPVVIALWPACVLAQLTTSDGDGSSAGEAGPAVTSSISVEQITADGDIEKRMTEILNATGWFTNVSVDADSGVLFLQGLAEDADRREWAEALGRNMEGVAAVVNQLEVDKSVDLAEALSVVMKSLRGLWQDALSHSPLVIAGILAIFLTGLASKAVQAVASRLAARSRLRGSIQDLILQLVTIAVWLVGLLVAAVIMFPGMTPARALAVLGLGSVAVGFAFKDIFENFFAGILILWKYPFDKGDFIECGAIKGRIEDITVRMSMIRQVDGQLVVVPNAMLFKNAVDVLTSRTVRRTTVICGVAYDTDLEKAHDVMEKAVQDCPSVDRGEPVQIFAREFADSSINFEVTWWTGATPVEERESRHEVVNAVKKALDDAKIEIPFPQRTLWLPEPVRTREASGKLQENGQSGEQETLSNR